MSTKIIPTIRRLTQIVPRGSFSGLSSIGHIEADALYVGGSTVWHEALQSHSLGYRDNGRKIVRMVDDSWLLTANPRLLSTIDWGQGWHDYPTHSRPLLPHDPNIALREFLVAEQAKQGQENVGKLMRKILEDENIIRYKKGSLRYEEKSNGNVDIHYKTPEGEDCTVTVAKGVELFNGVIASRTFRAELAAFNGQDRVEDIMGYDFNSNSAPLVIHGTGPSGMWLAELCMRNGVDFVFASPTALKEVEKMQTHVRNGDVAKAILANKAKYFRSDTSSMYSADEFLAKNKNATDKKLLDIKKFINEFSQKHGLPPEKISVIVGDDGSVRCGRGAVCIGFDPVKPPRGVQLAVTAASEFAKDIAPQAIMGSLQHSLSRSFIALGTFKKLTVSQLMEGMALDKLFIGQTDRPVIKDFLKLAGIDLPIDDPFYTKLKDRVDNFRHAPKTPELALAEIVAAFKEAHPTADPKVFKAFEGAFTNAMILRPETKKLAKAAALQRRYMMMMMGTLALVGGGALLLETQQKSALLHQAQSRGPNGIPIHKALSKIKFQDEGEEGKDPNTVLAPILIRLNQKHLDFATVRSALIAVRQAKALCQTALDNSSSLTGSIPIHEKEIAALAKVEKRLSSIEKDMLKGRSNWTKPDEPREEGPSTRRDGPSTS